MAACCSAIQLLVLVLAASCSSALAERAERHSVGAAGHACFPAIGVVAQERLDAYAGTSIPFGASFWMWTAHLTEGHSCTDPPQNCTLSITVRSSAGELSARAFGAINVTVRSSELWPGIVRIAGPAGDAARSLGTLSLDGLATEVVATVEAAIEQTCYPDGGDAVVTYNDTTTAVNVRAMPCAGGSLCCVALAEGAESDEYSPIAASYPAPVLTLSGAANYDLTAAQRVPGLIFERGCDGMATIQGGLNVGTDLFIADLVFEPWLAGTPPFRLTDLFPTVRPPHTSPAALS
jgi:hypothetical protein